jgi:hypothetical protein
MAVSPVVARTLAGELRSWQGLTHPIVTAYGTTWVVKRQSPADRRRELAVSRLGRGLVNVVETRGVTRWGHSRLTRLGLVDGAVPRDSLLLSRLASTYRSSELPARTADAAIGGELCFSLWMRRRDPHVWNRAYTPSGLPVFFDLHASLDFEPTLRNLEEFFAVNLHGHGGAWRVRAHSDPPTRTRATRTGSEITTVMVRSIAATQEAASQLVPLLRERARSAARVLRSQRWPRDEAMAMADFLRESARDLPVALERMWDIATSDLPTPVEESLIPDYLG